MKLPTVETPVYTTNLISNNQEITYRPFFVKEEKILLTVLQEKDNKLSLNNFLRILDNCILTENIDVKKMAFFDALYVFINIRSKSIGSTFDINVIDSKEKKKFNNTVNLSEIEIIKKDKIQTNFKINDKMGVVFNYPSISDVYGLNSENLNEDKTISLIASCIKEIYDEKEVYDCENYTKEELLEFIENLTPDMLLKISNFFNNVPKIVYKKQIKSPFGDHKIDIEIEDFIDFLT